MSAQYQVLVLDYDGSAVDLIDMRRLESLEYTRKLNDISDCTLTFSSDTDRAFDYHDKYDYLLEIMRKDTGDWQIEGTFLLRGQDIAERNRRERLILAGRSLEDFLRRRIINPDDDPTGAGGFSTKAGYADAVMIDYVTDQCISPALNAARTMTGLSAAATLNVGNQTFQRRKQEDKLLEVLKDIAHQTDIDFRIVRTSGAAFEFQAVFIGVDRTKSTNYPHASFLMFDPRRGNVVNPRLMVNRADEVNFMYIAGQGTEDNRDYLPVSDHVQVAVSPWNRCEDTADARNNESTDEILASGAAELRDRRATIELSFEPNLNSASAQYKTVWDLGDRVTGAYHNFEEDLRIIEVEVKISDSGETVKPKIEHV